MVLGASIMELWGLPLKSILTSFSSQYSMMPLYGPCGGFLKCLVDLLYRNVFLCIADEVDNGDGGRGDAHGIAVNLAFQPLDQFAYQFGGAGGGGYNIEGSGAGPADILMDDIQYFLVVSIGVDGGHQPLGDPEVFMQHLDRRRDAVGGAGSIRDNVMLFRVIGAFINAKHDSSSPRSWQARR